jgi:hypothetical protein
MKIDHHDENHLSVQTETFQKGAEIFRRKPLANLVVIIFSFLLWFALVIQPDSSNKTLSIIYEQLLRNPVGKIVVALGLCASGLVVLISSLRLPPPQRIPKTKYIFDLESDTILDKSEIKNVCGNVSQIKNIQLLFHIETTQDDETAIATNIDSLYSVEINFQNKKSLQLEFNSCSLIGSDNDKSAFSQLISDSDETVKMLQKFLNLGDSSDEIS